MNADGTPDSTFNPGANGGVHCLAVQGDGKILVGGYFTTLGGQTRNRIGRLNANGTLDSTFNPGVGYIVYSLVLQADGKILVAGMFATLDGHARSCLGRLNADGTLDSAFNSEASHSDGCTPSVHALAVQADGKILVGGDFTALGGQPRMNIGRLNASELAAQNLNCDGSTITWLRGGTSPEVWRTTFESSTNETDWTGLGTGMRIPGGWQLHGVSLPTNGTLRARGYATGGYYNGSGWYVEAYSSTSLRLFSQPQSRTNDAGTTAEFTVVVGSTPAPRFQWFKAGVPLASAGNVSGATSATLTLANVLGADSGDYWVVVSNSQSSVTSASATLTVRDPVIAVQPVSQYRNAGGSVTLSATVAGTEPLTYQWWKNGGTLSGATAASLTLTNLQCSDAGSYLLTRRCLRPTRCSIGEGVGWAGQPEGWI